MTKAELRAELERGAMMGDLFRFTSGQEGEILKADTFEAGDQIIYIPDIWLNGIPVRPLKDESEIENMLDCCYTGNDFI